MIKLHTESPFALKKPEASTSFLFLDSPVQFTRDFKSTNKNPKRGAYSRDLILASMFGNSCVTPKTIRKIRHSINKAGEMSINTAFEVDALLEHGTNGAASLAVALSASDHEAARSALINLHAASPKTFSAIINCHLDELQHQSPLVRAMYLSEISSLGIPMDRISREQQLACDFWRDVARSQYHEAKSAEEGRTQEELTLFLLDIERRMPGAVDRGCLEMRIAIDYAAKRFDCDQNEETQQQNDETIRPMGN